MSRPILRKRQRDHAVGKVNWLIPGFYAIEFNDSGLGCEHVGRGIDDGERFPAEIVSTIATEGVRSEAVTSGGGISGGGR